MNRKHSVANRQLKGGVVGESTEHRSTSQRVVQPNMLYVIGLPPALANEDLLRRHDYCGQYGRISRVLIKDSTSNSYGSYSVYVTYSTEEEASLAMLALNNFLYDRYRMYASYGTNKYCSQFVKQGRCQKRDCLFLHRLDPAREVTEEDNKKHFQDQQILAARLLASKHRQLDFSGSSKTVFPDRSYVYRLLRDEGFIDALLKEECTLSVKFKSEESDGEGRHQQRCSRLKEGVLRSENSTECSPKHESSLQITPHDEQDSERTIMKRILFRVARNKGSVLGFSEVSSKDATESDRESVFARIRQMMWD